MASVVAKGIDVSKHQKTVDWEKVKAAGIQFAIIRAGFGRNNIDPYFQAEHHRVRQTRDPGRDFLVFLRLKRGGGQKGGGILPRGDRAV